MFACTPQSQNLPYKTPASAATTPLWYGYSYEFFMNTQHEQISHFAKTLDGALVISNAAENNSSTTQELVIENVLSRFMNRTADSNTQKNAARLALEIKIQQQFLAHQIASFGTLHLSQDDMTFAQQDPQCASYIDSLQALAQTFDVFEYGELRIYEANDDLGLLAYQRSWKNTRAFVAFNFSFDNHELPLPFGFMASTKVRMWQSDAPEIQSFVTSQALTIRPYTAVIIIVG
jgi:hypothetical protein